MALFRPNREERRAISRDVWGRGLDPIAGDGVEKALRLVPVYAGTRLIADSVAGLPLQAFRQVGDQSQRITDPPLVRDPTRFGTSYEWVHRAMTSLLLRGNAFGLVTERDGMGFPTQIEWLNPDEVTVDDDRAVRNPVFRWLGNVIPRDDLIHIPGYVLPGRVLGLSPIKAFALQVDTGLLAQKFGKDFFERGGHPSAILKNAKVEKNPDNVKKVRERFKAAVSGRDIAVMTGGWEYEAIQVAPEESQFIQTLELNATQIAAVYGIYPAERIGGKSGSNTYANIEQDSIQFVQFTLRPYLVRLERAITKLMPERVYVRFNADALIRTDITARYRAHTESLTAGWRNVDEVREIEDLPPLPNGAGQNYLWPPRRSQLTQLEIEMGADDESGKHDADELAALEGESQEPAKAPRNLRLVREESE
jgi:HK97 family phage portal protein